MKKATVSGRNLKNKKNALYLEKDKVIHILDRFQDQDIEKWQRYGEKYREFSLLLFFDLFSQRKKYEKDLIKALKNCVKKDFKARGWQRLIQWKYSNDPLSDAGSLQSREGGGRFNVSSFVNPDLFKPFGALYLGSDRHVATSEVYAASSETEGMSPQEFFLRKNDSTTYVSVNAYFERYIDLREPESLKPLTGVSKKIKVSEVTLKAGKELGYTDIKTTFTEKELISSLLDPHWRRVPMLSDHPSNPQIFGELAKNAKIEAIIFPSVRYPDGLCAAVFSENLKKTKSFVEINGDCPDSVIRKRLDKNSL